MKIRRLLRILHRDLGYFIVGMTFVYVLSGIYLNHRHDFNPDYKIFYEEIIAENIPSGEYSTQDVKQILMQFNFKAQYRKHYSTSQGNIKVFIENGEAVIDPVTGKASLTYLRRRPLVFEMNLLHRASIGSTWKWVSDAMAAILLFVAVSGLFLLNGKRSLTSWGWMWLTAGLLLPLVFILFYI